MNYQKFNWSLVCAAFLTLATYTIGVYFGWVPVAKLPWLEIAAVFTSYSCTLLCVWQSRHNYLIGGVSVALYAWIFYSMGLYGSMALQFYLMPVMIYGWVRWGRDDRTLPVTSVFSDKWYWIPIYAMIVLSAWGAVYNINLFLNAKMASLDAGIFVASVLAQFLLDNKKLENWIVWIVVNIISIYVYFKAGLFFVGVQYVLFLCNAFYGLWSWGMDMNKDKPIVFGRLGG